MLRYYKLRSIYGRTSRVAYYTVVSFMGLEIVPFTSEYIDEAARLLASRYRADRVLEQELPIKFEDVNATRRTVKAQFQSPGAVGVVALRGGNVSGYIISQIGQGAAWIGYSGHAAVSEDGFEVYRSLYASLAPQWMAVGCVAQFVGVAAMDTQTLAAWYSMGFGQGMVRAVRATAPVGGANAVAGVQIRRAGPDDSSVVGRLSTRLAEYESGPPIYGRPAPELVADGNGYKWALADSRYAYWLAESDGKAVALVSLEPLPSFFGELVVPDRCVFLGKAFVEADARGSGIATALLGQGLAWARSAGYEQCMLNFKPMNLLGARFWQGHGFRPLAYSMCRLVDQRIS